MDCVKDPMKLWIQMQFCISYCNMMLRISKGMSPCLTVNNLYIMPQPWAMFCYILLILAGATSRHSFMGAGWVISIFSLFFQKIKIVHFNCVYLLNVNCQISKWINIYSRRPKYTNFLSLVQTCTVLKSPYENLMIVFILTH